MYSSVAGSFFNLSENIYTVIVMQMLEHFKNNMPFEMLYKLASLYYSAL